MSPNRESRPGLAKLRRVLWVTAMYPSAENPANGAFVREQLDALRRERPGWRFDLLRIRPRGGVPEKLWAYASGCVRAFARATFGRYDLVHGHGLHGGMVARAPRAAPVVVTFHGSEVMADGQRPWSRRLASAVDRTIVVSRSMAELLGASAGRLVEVVPCGIDFEHFAPGEPAAARRRLGLNPDQRYALFPADPNRSVKRYPLFHAALERVNRPVQPLVLQGVPREKVVDYLRACDVMVLTSRSEGSPMVVKEALACDTPVVSVDVGDVAGLLAGVPNASVVPATPEDLARAIGDALEHPERLGGRARIDWLDSRRVARRVLAIYDELV